MAEWEIRPFETMGDNSPESQLIQVEQELEGLERKKEFLLEEKERYEQEINDASA